MKHRVSHKQLGRNTNQLKALRRGLVSSVFEKGRIETTQEKAKSVVGVIDRVMVFAKTDSVHHRREVIKILGSDMQLDQIFKNVAPKTGSRNSGFTRITKTGSRFSDGTQMAVLELVDYQPTTLPQVTSNDQAKEVKHEDKPVEKQKLETTVKPQKVTKAKAQNAQKIKAIGHK